MWLCDIIVNRGATLYRTDPTTTNRAPNTRYIALQAKESQVLTPLVEVS